MNSKNCSIRRLIECDDDHEKVIKICKRFLELTIQNTATTYLNKHSSTDCVKIFTHFVHYLCESFHKIIELQFFKCICRTFFVCFSLKITC